MGGGGGGILVGNCCQPIKITLQLGIKQANVFTRSCDSLGDRTACALVQSNTGFKDILAWTRSGVGRVGLGGGGGGE